MVFHPGDPVKPGFFSLPTPQVPYDGPVDNSFSVAAAQADLAAASKAIWGTSHPGWPPKRANRKFPVE